MINRLEGKKINHVSFPSLWLTMARNEEKSHSMLNRWLQLEKGPVQKQKVKRPHLVELCHDANEALRWRGQVVHEIAKNVLAIQNGMSHN